MLGALIIAPMILYWLFARFTVKKIYEKTQSLTKKRIAIAIFVLIPTWDIILGYPIYAYLCVTQTGIKIYKTVDNVEGFYVGEKMGEYFIEPYQGYQFIDYKDPKNGKYYRNSWLDNNTSTECIPYDGAYSYEYTQAFKSGKCIIKHELNESEVSRWWVKQYYSGTTKQIVPIFDINKFYEIQVYDRKIQKNIAEVVNCSWKGGWVHGIISSIETGSSNYFGCLDVYQKTEKMFISTTLKSKTGVSDGNN